MRATLTLFAALLISVPCEAQYLQPSLLSPVNDVAPSLPPSVVAKQAVSGLGGAMVGAFTAAAVTSLLLGNSRGNGFEELGTMVLASLGGAAVGSAAGVSMYSRRAGLKAPFAAPLLGGVVGVAGILAGPAVFVTVPLGSTIGYNLARERDPSP